MQKPAAGPHIGIGEHAPHPGGLGREAAERLVADVVDKAERGEALHQVVGAVVAIVGADEDMVEPDDAVKGDPFEREDALVPHACHDGGLHRVRFRLLGHRVRTA
jgi:hypothetical protein